MNALRCTNRYFLFITFLTFASLFLSIQAQGYPYTKYQETLRCLVQNDGLEGLTYRASGNGVMCVELKNFDPAQLWSYYKFTVEYPSDYEFDLIDVIRRTDDSIFREIISGEHHASYENTFSFQRTVHSFLKTFGFNGQTDDYGKHSYKFSFYVSPYDNFVNSILSPSDRLYVGFFLSGYTPVTITFTYESSAAFYGTLLLTSLLFFFFSKQLSESIIIYYIIYVFLGVFTGILLLVVIVIYLSKDKINFQSIFILLSLAVLGSAVVLTNYVMATISFFIVFGAFIGIYFSIKFADSRRSITKLTQFVTKTLSYIGLFLSFESAFFSLLVIITLSLLQFKAVRRLLRPFILPFMQLKWRYFPSRRKLISSEEYKQQGKYYTEAGIRELIDQVREDPNVLSLLSDEGREKTAQLLECNDHLRVILSPSKYNSQLNN